MSQNKEKSNVKVDVNFQYNDWKLAVNNITDRTEEICQTVLDFPGMNDSGKEIEISVLLCDDDHIQKLNNDFRGKNKPTNVLSFPNEDLDYEHIPDVLPVLHLGDVVLALQTIKQEAKAAHIEVEDHYAHLLVHGLLHLLGYDHKDDGDAAEMENLETGILRLLGVADPYF